ncbi:endonuclease domain-containing protein [Kaistia algarum]|uniref:endonuclease domain-containing protein n=1 Tax=Kaistia algarum TaxID=2083279 RepID=UPI000CE823F0|nr:endonuclease domain-containing protein [Kaistia algarum]MCX5514153.1 endonuclease domain-containing protein [Kaistia algarum]PPE77915.1 endonuclease domain-containing protein [Kaistia algarum]
MTSPETKIARRLRRDQTDVERRLWGYLRDRRLDGWKFRRQVPIDSFVADFVCKEAMLIVELDGSQHADHRAEHDARRTASLNILGYRVIRFWNNDVIGNLDGVLSAILAALKQAPHPDPLPQAGEGEEGTPVATS